MKNTIVVLVVGSVGYMAHLASSLPKRAERGTPEPSKVAKAGPARAKAESRSVEPVAPYQVVATEDHDLGKRRRVAIKVILEDRSTTEPQVWRCLLDLAESQEVDAVLVYAYWPGDDWNRAYTAGMLEWGRNGGGWSSKARLPLEGKFDGGPSRLALVSSKAPEVITPSRRGNVDHALVAKLRNAWQRNRVDKMSTTAQRDAILLMQAKVREMLSDPDDQEATLDYIGGNIGTW